MTTTRPRGKWKTRLLAVSILGMSMAIGACSYLHQPRFGASPDATSQALIAQSPNFRDGEFHNSVDTPLFTNGASFSKILLGNLFSHAERLRPAQPIPTRKTDLRQLDPAEDCVVWLGHSSFYVQLGGKRLLIDPVFSDYAAPVSFANRAFDGTTLYGVDDLPPIDYLLISHDHWDHVDHATLTALQGKVGQVVTALGIGSHLRAWGYPPEKIHEADWFDTPVAEAGGLKIHLIPARHYSGRLFERNQTLWTGFVVESAQRRLLFSGDSGYGPHYAAIAERFPRFDLVALDSGQYDDRWAYIHMTPEESADAAEQLHAARLLPAHLGRFAMARHAWDDPLQRSLKASAQRSYQLVTPMIGEPLRLADRDQTFSHWWQGLR